MQSALAIRFSVSGMLANDITNLLISASSPGNLLQQTATGGRLCGMVAGKQKKEETNGKERASQRKAINYHASTSN